MMSELQKRALAEMGGERLQFGCLMSPYTTFGIGGEAEAFFRARDAEDLRRVIIWLNQEGLPFFILGQGSNLLVRDKGLEGVVIVLGESLDFIEQDSQDQGLVLAGGGATLSSLLNFCRQKGLSGLEFLAGIPGSVGGATVMNAGAFGQEIESRIERVLILSPEGDLATRSRSRLEFRYRHLVLGPGSVILKVYFKLFPEAPEVISGRMGGYLKRRKQTQPLEFPSAGSVFKNPPGDYAGRLIEKAGLKGARVGGAMISEKHANYIVNTGQARAKDILSLIALAREKVQEQTGVRLETEIKIIGIE